MYATAELRGPGCVCYNILLFNHVPTIEQKYTIPLCGQHELHYYLFCYMYCVVYTRVGRVRRGTDQSRRRGLLRFSPNRTKLQSVVFRRKKKSNDILSIIPVTFFRDHWTPRIIFVTKLFFKQGLNKIQFTINPRK